MFMIPAPALLVCTVRAGAPQGTRIRFGIALLLILGRARHRTGAQQQQNALRGTGGGDAPGAYGAGVFGSGGCSSADPYAV